MFVSTVATPVFIAVVATSDCDRILFPAEIDRIKDQLGLLLFRFRGQRAKPGQEFSLRDSRVGVDELTLLPFFVGNDTERRVAINSIAPHWEGNQVWFVTAGGAIFAAWPFVYATAFSGFYIAMLAVLWALSLPPGRLRLP